MPQMRKAAAPKIAPEVDLGVIISGDGGLMKGCRVLSAYGDAYHPECDQIFFPLVAQVPLVVATKIRSTKFEIQNNTE